MREAVCFAALRRRGVAAIDGTSSGVRSWE